MDENQKAKGTVRASRSEAKADREDGGTVPLALENSIYYLQSYQFNLPPELIAQYPIEPRDQSRLLVLERQTGIIKDHIFSDIIDYLDSGDTLVLNDTRVIPARLYGYKGSGAKVEILLLNQRGKQWEALVRPAKRLKPGSRVKLDEQNGVEVEIIAELNLAGGRLIEFKNCADEMAFIDQMGQMPLPPYINRPAEKSDKRNYQTIYAREKGSAAAPTAGLHFSQELLQRIQDKGINLGYVLLHVGLGTFRPVSSEDIREHQMHYEYYRVNEETAALLNQTRQKNKKIIAVGTTVVRTLETVYNTKHGFTAGEGETNKFIYPGYEIKAVDRLITNFHLPGSSLIMLVAAFAGYDNTMTAYRHAVENNYRFFSYGDAMLIV
ncbi:MAG: tRNA preQ1(34) S-adenosylmethionine ribosyltransferase-isomerase QueA [Syntrophomonadaceae bacterium]|nr:tRNA preQ1(34) S-adenosylmethionine ribosyltransferase-isomerase QueA [Syntrophomonadaceae bacterium]